MIFETKLDKGVDCKLLDNEMGYCVITNKDCIDSTIPQECPLRKEDVIITLDDEILNDNISALRLTLYDYDDPMKMLKQYLIEDMKCVNWVPQTMGEQIWVSYEFKSKEDRIKWEESLPEEISNWLDRNLIGRSA